jgi:superfamily II DNA or RNA helicase
VKAKAPRGNAGRRISLTDSRDSAPSASFPSNVSPTLREYQCAAVEHVIAARDRGETCGLVSLPTGTGKTIIAAEVLHRLDGRALVVAHTAVLVTQLRDALADYLSEPIGLVLNGNIEAAHERVVVASRQSLNAQRLAAIAEAGPFETLVFDEAHHASHDSTYAAILSAVRSGSAALFVLGLTATPWREAGRMLFERWWFSREISDLIPLRVLAPVRYQTVELPLALREVRLSGGYDREYPCKALEPQLLDVAEETAARVTPLITDLGHIVIFAVTVKHAHALAEAFERVGVGAVPIWGTMRACDRDDVLRRWRSAEIRALVNVGIVTEGFDEPRISGIIFARPTASTLFYMQALGRGLRTAPGKEECLVVDCVGLGDLRDARQCTLDAIVPEVAALEGLPPSSPQGRRLVAAPGDDDVRLWHRIAPDAYALALDSREFFFVVRDASTGLYCAWYVATNKIRERFEPAPFAALLSTLRERLRGRTLVFGTRKASWRRLPPTEAQIRALAAIQATWATRAIEEGWQRGRLASALTTVYARRLAHRLGILNEEAA